MSLKAGITLWNPLGLIFPSYFKLNVLALRLELLGPNIIDNSRDPARLIVLIVNFAAGG